jgi:SAM-dependent methyltransferase
LFAHCEYKTHDFGEEPGTVGHYTPLDYVSDITEIPVPNASFDVILCTEVLEHVPEPIQAVAEISRILKPGGRAILTAPLGSRLHQEPYHFYGGYTPYWYQNFLPMYGLEIETITPNQGFFSYFAQEAVYFHCVIAPWNWKVSWRWAKLILALLWLVTLPLCRLLLPASAFYLDRLDIEKTGTIGYHVLARKCLY